MQMNCMRVEVIGVYVVESIGVDRLMDVTNHTLGHGQGFDSRLNRSSHYTWLSASVTILHPNQLYRPLYGCFFITPTEH